MKMQEVITQLRELAPAAAHSARQAFVSASSLRTILEDASHAQSAESMVALVKLASDKLTNMWMSLKNCEDDTRKLQALNESYKERLGPRAKKPKDAPGQQMLPGLEDVGGTPTTLGETSTTVGRTPSFMQSGRHG